MGLKKKIKINRVQDPTLASARPSEHIFKENTKYAQFVLIALLPVYNAQKWLPETLEALSRGVDAIIALDDGSTDGSLDLLTACNKVIRIIKKPPKDLVEWNDAQNRYELYCAAAEYAPQWVLCVDADEILDEHFAAFRETLMNAGTDIRGYAFHVDDFDQGFITRERFGHRMYRYQSGSLFDKRRLHCRLLPLDITLDEIRLVNLRLKHAADPQTQETRFKKYVQADPLLYYQSSYTHLLKPFFRKVNYSLGDRPVLCPVQDDGLQRRRSIRTIKGYDKLFADQSAVQYFVDLTHTAQKDMAALIGCFACIKLDAFLINRSRVDGLQACYSFDASKDVKASLTEAWLIEELHSNRDFCKIFGKFWLIHKTKTPEKVKKMFIELLRSLREKRVIYFKKGGVNVPDCL